MMFDASALAAIGDELALCRLTGDDPLTSVGAEAVNYLSAYWYAVDRDAPARWWWNAPARHPAVARALQVDAADPGATYALYPFRLARIDGQPRILVAHPAPHMLAPPDFDYLRIETVLAWDPRADTVEVLGDPAPQLVGRLETDAETATIHGGAFEFFRAVVEQRAQFLALRGSVTGDWMRKPVERDATPGLLLIGDPARISWPIHTMPADVECRSCDAQAVNRAMLRQARVPRARAAAAQQRAA